MISKSIDVLVIGSGIAGLLATKLLSEQKISVLIATDSSILGSGASYFPLKATLGIQTSDPNPNNKDLFTEDFLRVSGNLIDINKMNIYINESTGKANLLTKIGLDPTLRQDKRPACFAKYSRPIHLISAWQKSQEYVQTDFENSEHIEILYQTKAIKLFSKNNTITGALLFSKGEYIVVQAKVVILATGGIAGLYQHNLYPTTIDGSGWALAEDIGAKLINTEFIQFIPSFLKPKYKVLFGEHTIKYLKNVYDSKGNDLFKDLNKEEKQQLFYERSGYAPFSIDFKSSLFDIRIFEANKNGDVQFEYSPELYKDNEAFYTIYLDWLTNKQQINLLTDDIKISHFAHASNGGIQISIDAESSVHNLYALGEVSCGVEGANRMGGNSVGGIVVFTPRAVANITKKIAHIPFHSINELHQQSQLFLQTLKQSISDSSLTSSEVKKQLGVLLQNNASIVRNQNDLYKTLNQINQLQNQYHIISQNETKEGYSVYLALKASQLLIQSMINRNESIGAHYKTTIS